jgi:hypothetical protein
MFHQNFIREEKCYQLLNIVLQMYWPELGSKRLQGFHQLLYFSLLCNFLIFQIFKQLISKRNNIFQNNGIIAESEKVLGYLV